MYLNQHLCYSLIRVKKCIELELPTLLESLEYKLPGKILQDIDCGVGFDVHVELEENVNQDNHIVISVDAVRNVIRIYIHDELNLEGNFQTIRTNFVEVVNAIKEYIVELKLVENLIDGL